MSFSSDDEDFVMESLLDDLEEDILTNGEVPKDVGKSTDRVSSSDDEDFVMESLLDDLEDDILTNAETPKVVGKSTDRVSSSDNEDFVIDSLLDGLGNDDSTNPELMKNDINLTENKMAKELPRSFLRSQSEKKIVINNESPKSYKKSRSVEEQSGMEDLGIEYTTITHEPQNQKGLPSVLNYWGSMKSKQLLTRTNSLPVGHKHVWLDAMERAKHAEDPWNKFNIIEECPSERAKRFRYDALKKKWVQDEVIVKIQTESFGHGAMRKCFRMKKLSTMVHRDDWRYASNFVAKRYFDDDVFPKTYFDDVKLQMDAKLWAEEYNRHHPPKKIDIIQVGCIKLMEREGAPMYHIEHFVEGKYVKYNSNSGFVLREEDNLRATPQAFSHFSFERSGHQMIVVDVQGVGDLYTDPQIHTAKGDEYGEANLGTKGIALFFATHECSMICEELRLERFDLSESEFHRLTLVSSRSSTATEVKSSTESSTPGEKMEPMFDLVERLQSVNSSDSGIVSDLNAVCNDVPSQKFLSPRQRLFSEADSGNGSDSDCSAHERFFRQHHKKVSCVDPDGMVFRVISSDTIANRLKCLSNYEEQQTSILSQVHFDLALYNYIGRFTENQPDMQSTLFHLERAALSGSSQANKLLAYKYSSLNTEMFEDLDVEEDLDRAVDYFIEAASRGDKDSMIKTAKAFDTGINLGKTRQVSWTEALRWYNAALNQVESSSQCNFNANPNYEITARMAHIWRTGGNGVEKDANHAGELYTTAAEEAMNCGKGKLSNKYYMLAEEVWGEMEE